MPIRMHFGIRIITTFQVSGDFGLFWIRADLITLRIGCVERQSCQIYQRGGGNECCMQITCKFDYRFLTH